MTPSEPELADERAQSLTEFAARSRHARRREGLDHAAAVAIAAFDHSGVEALVLKGAALAQTLYSPTRERNYFDIDFLVAPQGRRSAENILSELGYRNVTNDQGVDDVAGALHAELWTRIDRDLGNVTIDLHWKLAGCGASSMELWSVMRPEAQAITVGDRPALTMSKAGLALHTALHVAQHGGSDAKAVGDLRLALKRWGPDVWDRAAALAHELRGLDAFSAGLRLTPDGILIAEMLGLSSGERVLWDLEHRDARPRGTFHLAALAQAASRREQLAVLRRALFPAPNWIRWEMRWAARSPIHLAAGYLRHLTRTPAWAARALRFRRQRPS